MRNKRFSRIAAIGLVAAATLGMAGAANAAAPAAAPAAAAPAAPASSSAAAAGPVQYSDWSNPVRLKVQNVTYRTQVDASLVYYNGKDGMLAKQSMPREGNTMLRTSDASGAHDFQGYFKFEDGGTAEFTMKNPAMGKPFMTWGSSKTEYTFSEMQRRWFDAGTHSFEVVRGNDLTDGQKTFWIYIHH